MASPDARTSFYCSGPERMERVLDSALQKEWVIPTVPIRVVLDSPGSVFEERIPCANLTDGLETTFRQKGKLLTAETNLNFAQSHPALVLVGAVTPCNIYLTFLLLPADEVDKNANNKADTVIGVGLTEATLLAPNRIITVKELSGDHIAWLLTLSSHLSRPQVIPGTEDLANPEVMERAWRYNTLRKRWGHFFRVTPQDFPPMIDQLARSYRRDMELHPNLTVPTYR